MTRGDLGIVAVVGLLIAAAMLTAARSGAVEQVVIRGPYGVTAVDLAESRTYVIEGREGTVEFETRNGKLVCVDSSCPDHVCVKQGVVEPGRPVVCAPNGVIAAVEGSPDGGLDAVSR